MLPPMIIFDGKDTKTIRKLLRGQSIIYFSNKIDNAYNDKVGFQFWIDEVFLRYLPK